MIARALYTLGWWLATPLAAAYLLWRGLRQPAYRRNWLERWALAPVHAPDGPLVWVHAVSVGETRAAQPLVSALLARDPDLRVLLTHVTPTGRDTGAHLFAGRFGERVMQCYLPYDTPGAMRRFLDAWDPSLGILMETEVWPNLCAAASEREMPLALVNARLSERSLRKGLRWGWLIRPALRSLACVIAQTEQDARRLQALGRDAVAAVGNMKFDATPLPEMVERGRGWRVFAGNRPVVLAASTRDGEEALLLDAWQQAIKPHVALARRPIDPEPLPLLVIVPRHPQRFDEVAALIEARRLRFSRRSQLDTGDPQWAGAQVLLGDSMGEMFAWYGMSDVAIIGGTLLPFGGQNLIESCASGVPVLLGPHTYNFSEAAEQALADGAALRVADAGAAVELALGLLGDRERRAAMGAAGEQFAARHRGATQRTIARLARWLP